MEHAILPAYRKDTGRIPEGHRKGNTGGVKGPVACSLTGPGISKRGSARRLVKPEAHRKEKAALSSFEARESFWAESGTAETQKVSKIPTYQKGTGRVTEVMLSDPR